MRKRFLLFSTLTYFILAGTTFPYLCRYVDNPDTISYLTLAQKFLHGDFANALNGYWSPLVVWLLGLALTFGGEPETTFKILQAGIGWFALINWNVLVQRTIRNPFLQGLLIFLAIPFLVSWAYLNLTADLLFLAVILFYLNMVSDKEFFNHRNFGIIAGVLSALAYFSKSFGVFFFFAHFTVLFLKNFHLIKESPYRKHLVRNYFYVIVCFIFISGWWVWMVSTKYGHFTLSESAAFNQSREVTGAPGKTVELPILSGGLIAPVNPSAVNAWEDPGLAIKTTRLHPFSDDKDLRQYLNGIKRNLLSIYYFDFNRQAGTIFIVLLLFVLFTSYRKKIIENDYFFSCLLAILVIYGGYSLILVHPRYTWLSLLAMLLVSGYLVETVFFNSEAKWRKPAGLAIMLLTAALAVKRPLKEILFSEDLDVNAGMLFVSVFHPFKTMEQTYHFDEMLKNAGTELKNIIPEKSHLASLKENSIPRDAYTQSSRIALSTGGKYFGQIPLNDSTGSLMKTHSIDYVISFGLETRFDTSAGWKKVFVKKEIPAQVFKKK